MSKALRLLGGPDAEDTANFIALFDKFFDSFNVSNTQKQIATGNFFGSLTVQVMISV